MPSFRGSGRSKHSRMSAPPDLTLAAGVATSEAQSAAASSPLPIRHGRALAVTPAVACAQFLDAASRRATPLAEKSLSNYEKVLRVLVAYLEQERGRRDVWEVTADDLNAWFYTLRSVPSARTGQMLSLHSVQNYATHALSCWRWLVSESLAPEHALHGVRMPSVPRNLQRAKETFTDEDIDALMAACALDGEGPGETAALTLRNQALVAVLLDTGVRREELASMRVEGIDWERRALQVTISKTKIRVVGIGGERAPTLLRRYVQRARPWLLEIQEESNHRLGITPERGPLWLNRDGAALAMVGVSELFDRLKRRAEITGPCSPHVCRRYYITRAIQAGVPLPDIARQCGVSVEVIYRHYYAATEGEFLARVQAGSPMDRLERQRRLTAQKTDGGRRRREGDILGD